MPGTTHSRRRHERGQVLAVVAILLSALGGMTAIAIDLGSYSADRRDLQNAADSIALAASQELPNADAARAVANEWAGKNGVELDEMDVTIIPQNIPSEPNPKVRVELTRPHEFTFARMIGIASTDVQATSAAVKTSAAGGDGVIPLSVTEDVLAGAVLGDLVTLKYDANDISQGNTSPVRIDGGGTGNCNSTDAYCDGIIFGSDSTVCAAGTDTTYCSGRSIVDTQPGNVVGGTRVAIQTRLDTTGSECDEFTETFEDDPTTSEQGVYRITPECNPFINGSYASERVIIIPVIDHLCNGSCDVTIVEFGLFFLEGFAVETDNGNGNGNGNQACTGTECEVTGRFVRVNQNIGLLAGTFDEASYNHFVRLVN